jgi:glyceraldehyde 3-phosphate dehydrogenase
MPKLRIAINGFGRIGRQVLKAMLERHPDKMEVVAINDLFDVTTNAHLLSYDTNYGKLPVAAQAEGDIMTVGDWRIKNFAERDPRGLPWQDLAVDVVIESTGIFRTGPKCRAHLDAGAKKVIITARPRKRT